MYRMFGRAACLGAGCACVGEESAAYAVSAARTSDFIGGAVGEPRVFWAGSNVGVGGGGCPTSAATPDQNSALFGAMLETSVLQELRRLPSSARRGGLAEIAVELAGVKEMVEQSPTYAELIGDRDLRELAVQIMLSNTRVSPRYLDLLQERKEIKMIETAGGTAPDGGNAPGTISIGASAQFHSQHGHG